MSNDTTQHTPADVRERVVEIVREAMEDAAGAERRGTFEQHGAGHYTDRILTLLRTPRGEGSATDLLDEYLPHLTWTEAATEDEKTLVIGNLTAFAAWLDMRTGRTPTRPWPCCGVPMTEPHPPSCPRRHAGSRHVPGVCPGHAAEIARLERELSEARERERRLCRALGDLIGLAEAAMREADDCGGEYDVDGELSDARALLAEVEPLHPDLWDGEDAR